MSNLQDTLKNRARFYQDGVKSGKRVNSLLAGGFVLMGLVNLLLIATPPVERYIPTGPGCRVEHLTALDEPYMTTADVVEYAADAAVGVYTFSSANYQRDLSPTKDRFFSDSWDKWIKATEDNGLLDYVITTGSMVTAYASDEAPVVIDEGLGLAGDAYADRYAWEINVPMSVTYSSKGARIPQRLYARVIVARRGYGDDPFMKGLGVVSMIVRENR